MANDTIPQAPQPVDPPVDHVVGIDGEATGDADTEGHSMLSLDLARSIDADRLRGADRTSHTPVRARDAAPSRGDRILKRLGRH
jgi:hypothetical protein